LRTLNRHKLSLGHIQNINIPTNCSQDYTAIDNNKTITGIDNITLPNSSNDSSNSDNELSSSLSRVCLFSSCSKTQAAFFHAEHHNRDGLDRLVCNGLYGNPELSYLLDDDDVEIHLTLANLFGDMVIDHQTKLSRVFFLLNRKCLKANCNILQQSKVPISITDVKRQYTSNSSAIIQNLPSPSVYTNGYGRHAYVSLIECIQDLLGHSSSVIQPITTNSSPITEYPYHCSRAKTIMSDAVRTLSPMNDSDLILFLYDWADAFAPSNSSKDNRGSAWAKTVTISYNPHISVEGDNTYVISIGPASDSHEFIEAQYGKDLDILRSGKLMLHCAKAKKKVRVYADILVSLKDQPERRSSNNILLGSSTYTTRWGYSGDLFQTYNMIPSCPTCQIHLRDNIIPIDKPCTECYNWDTQNITFFPPLDYPSEICAPHQKLNTTKMDYQSLITAVRFTTNKLNLTTTGRWTKPNARQYLKVIGLNTETVSAIINKAKETLDTIKWHVPSLWQRNVPLDLHIDVPMHLLCLGIIKAVVILIHDWSVAYKKGQTLSSTCDTNLDIIKHMHMSWAPAVPYSNGKLGGWVSENFLVLCKIMPWFDLRFCNNCLDDQQQQQDLQLLVTSLRAMMSRIMNQSTSEALILDTMRHIKIISQCLCEI
jgi:hypothetical protein